MFCRHNGFVNKKTIAHLFHPQRSNNHRPRVLHPLPLFYLTLLAIGFAGFLRMGLIFSGSFDRVLGYASSITPEKVVRMTNAEREEKTLEPVRYNQVLSEAALAKAQDMFSDQYWAHVAPDGKQPWDFLADAEYTYTLAGENLARDFMTTEAMVEAWMKSPSHRENILQSRYTEIGVAVVDGILFGHETTLVVQMFGTPSTGQAPSISDSAMQATAPNPGLNVAPVTEEGQPAVLASVTVPGGSIEVPPLFTPLQLAKAVFLSIIMIVSGTLLYDMVVVGHRQTARAVGKNLAHIAYLAVVAYLIIFFKAGVIG